LERYESFRAVQASINGSPIRPDARLPEQQIGRALQMADHRPHPTPLDQQRASLQNTC
jgi:hypothetical protein